MSVAFFSLSDVRNMASWVSIPYFFQHEFSEYSTRACAKMFQVGNANDGGKSNLIKGIVEMNNYFCRFFCNLKQRMQYNAI